MSHGDYRHAAECAQSYPEPERARAPGRSAPGPNISQARSGMPLQSQRPAHRIGRHGSEALVRRGPPLIGDCDLSTQARRDRRIFSDCEQLPGSPSASGVAAIGSPGLPGFTACPHAASGSDCAGRSLADRPGTGPDGAEHWRRSGEPGTADCRFSLRVGVSRASAPRSPSPSRRSPGGRGCCCGFPPRTRAGALPAVWSG